MLLRILVLLILPFFSFAQNPFYQGKVQKLEIEFYEQHWENKLKAYKKTGSDKRLKASFKLEGIQFDTVGIRFKGNSSYNNPRKKENRKLPFNIDIDAYEKKAELPDGTDKLKLSNSFRDPSYLREPLSYHVIGNYLPVPSTAFFNLFVNGEDYGLYIGAASIDKQFLKNNFGTKKGLLIKCDPDYDVADLPDCEIQRTASLKLFENKECYKTRYEVKKDKAWPALEKLIQTLAENPEALSESLDVFQVLWMHALNNVLVNLDSYTGKLSHNYYLYRDTSKVWHPLPWDMNMSFGGFVFDGKKNAALSSEELIRFPIFAHIDNEDRPLIKQLISQPLYRKVYAGMVKTIAEDFFVSERYKAIIKEYQSVISEVVQGSGKKLYSAKDYIENVSSSVKAGKSNIIGITELMDGRMEYLKSTPVFEADQPEHIKTIQEESDGNWLLKLEVKNTDKVQAYVQDYSLGPWRVQEVNYDGEFWNLGYSSDQKPHACFFVLENDRHASLFPSNAPKRLIQVQ